MARQCGLNEGNDLHFVAFSYHEMATIYSRANVCAITSVRESFGVERRIARHVHIPEHQMAYSRMPRSSASRLRKRRENGLLFEHGDHVELFKQISQVLEDKALALTLANAARGTVKEGKYRAERMVRDHYGFYASTMDRTTVQNRTTK